MKFSEHAPNPSVTPWIYEPDEQRANSLKLIVIKLAWKPEMFNKIWRNLMKKNEMDSWFDIIHSIIF